MRKRIILTAILVLSILLLSGMVACSDQPAEEGENAAVDNVSVDHAHTYGEWSIVTPATCTTAGARRRSCTTCGNSETEEIAALGHNFVGVTCTRCRLTLRETTGLSFELKDDHTYTLTGYTGTDTDVVVLTTHSGIAVTSISNDAFKGNATIKSVIIAGSSNAALTIGKGVFADCTALTSVSLPANVISMGNIFSGCTALENIFVDENNSEYTSVNGVLFTKDKTKLLKYPGGKVSNEYLLTDNVTAISSDAFNDCDEITIELSTTQIGLLKGVSAQLNLIISKGEEVSGCSGWKNLKSVAISEGVTSIKKSAFSNCSNLISVTIPKSVTSVECSAFGYCKNLASVYYNGGIVTWCEIIFHTDSYSTSDYDSYHPNPLYYAHNLYINNALVTEITIPDTVTEIKQYAFQGWNGTSVKIGNNVETIGSKAFENCENLSNIYWGEDSHLDRIEYEAFYNCQSLKKVDFPNGLTFIGQSSFQNCFNLLSITIPETVTVINYSAFYHCFKLVEVYQKSTSLEIRETLDYVRATYTEPYTSKISTDENGYIYYKDGKDIVLLGYAGTDTELILPNNITEINAGAFYENKDITRIEIPDSVTKIGDRAFYNCDNLQYNQYDNAYYLGNKNNPYIILIKAINKDISSLSIPETTKFIHFRAIYECNNIETILIPDSVIDIGVCAFQSNEGLKNISIGDSVLELGLGAFNDCINLKEVTIGKNVKKIGEDAFASCTLEKVFYTGDINSWCKIVFDDLDSNPLYEGNKIYVYNNNAILYINDEKPSGDIVLSDDITHIPAGTFKGSTITSITIPDSVTRIGSNAFYNCSRLTSVYYTGDIASWCGITFDGYRYFNNSYYNGYSNPLEYAHNLYINNTLVTEITIPDTITEIKTHAFYNWTWLTSVTIGNSATSIEVGAFYNCSSLTSVTIGNSVTSIGYYAFLGCRGLTSIYYTGDIASWCGISFGGSGANPLEYAHNLYINYTLVTEITIPDTVTEIKANAFYGWNGTSITIPDSVTSIGGSAFSGCYKLVEVYNKSSLNITKGSSDYGYVGRYAKAIYTEPYESKLSTDENGYILYTDGDDISLIGYAGTETQLILPDGIAKIYQYAFHNNRTITSVTIPDSVTSIGSDAFYDCSSLTSITIPDSVTSIEYSVFYNCGNFTSVYYTGDIASWCEITFGNEYSNPLQYAHNLYINNTLVTEITISETVTEIKKYIFAGWNGTSITIPDSVTSIEYQAFYGCKNLTSVTIGSSVTSIRDNAFYGCNKLVEVYNKSSLNIRKGSGSSYGWVGEYAKAIYTEPYESKLSTDENGYILYTDGDHISLIGYTGTDRELTLPNGIAEIHSAAFYGNNTITSITIPDSVRSIGWGAFYECRSLMSITIPDSVTSIWGSAFSNCSGLTSITIPDSVTSIGEWAFSNCSSLTSITIPDSVTSIQYDAFSNCSSLTSITFEGTKAQWNAISKGNYWNYNTGKYTIHCTDGDISK